MMMPAKSRPDFVDFATTPVQQMAASCTGALLTSICMTPLDVVKIRLQSQQKAQLSKNCYVFCNGLMDHVCPCNHRGYTRIVKPVQFTGTFDAFVKISRSEGVASLWSGLGPTLVLAIPATVVYFVLYEQFKARLTYSYLKNSTRPTSTISAATPYWIPLISGACARMISATAVSPLELIRTKMQSKRLSYFEVFGVLKQLIELHGLKGLWKGLGSTLLRDVPFSGIYWMNYEIIKRKFWNGEPSFAFYFSAGAISGCLAAIVTVPFDVVKTHQQIDIGGKTNNVLGIMRNIYIRNGIRGLYAGLTPRLFKVAPACAIMIGSFEYGKAFFVKKNNNLYMVQDHKSGE